MYLIRKHSSTSNMFRVLLRHSTTGQGLTGLSSASSGLIISTINDNEATATAYTVAGATIETVTTLGTFAAPTAAKVRFREVDVTNHPGLYEVQIADARFAVASAKILRIAVSGATNMLGRGVAVQFDAVPSDVTHLLGTGWLAPAVAGCADVNTKTITTGAITASSIADGAIDTATFAAGTTIPRVTLADTVTTYTSNTPQTGDSFARIGAAGVGLTNLGDARLANLDVAISVIQSQITALNNLSAKANWFGYPLLEVPDTGTRAYVFELVIKDDEDKLVNLDGLPTITLTNAAGLDRSALITAPVANPSAGRYTITITVGAATVNEPLKLTATGAISGETRYAATGTQVVDYDTAALTNQIWTAIGTAGAGLTNLGDARLANLDATISSRLATAGYTAPSNLTAAQIATGVWQDTTVGDFTVALSVGKSVMNGVTLGTGLTIVSVSGAVGSVAGFSPGDITTIMARLGSWTGSGINTILGAFRAATGKAAALTPTDISTGTTYDNTTDALEAIRDAAGGGGSATLENQAAILAKVNLLNPAPTGSVLLVSSGTYYCTRQDVELVFGKQNVIKWADLDNVADPVFIENRITTMIALAHEQTNDALRSGGYKIPVVAPVPTTLTYQVAALAGVLLYESRGEVDADNEDGSHRLTPFRKRWAQYIRDILGQKVVLSATRSIVNSSPAVS